MFIYGRSDGLDKAEDFLAAGACSEQGLGRGLVDTAVCKMGVHVSWSPRAPFCINETQVKTVIFSRIKL
jgi:hypothetical protein